MVEESWLDPEEMEELGSAMDVGMVVMDDALGKPEVERLSLPMWVPGMHKQAQEIQGLDIVPYKICPPNIWARSSLPTLFSSCTIVTWLKKARI